MYVWGRVSNPFFNFNARDLEHEPASDVGFACRHALREGGVPPRHSHQFSTRGPERHLASIVSCAALPVHHLLARLAKPACVAGGYRLRLLALDDGLYSGGVRSLAQGLTELPLWLILCCCCSCWCCCCACCCTEADRLSPLLLSLRMVKSRMPVTKVFINSAGERCSWYSRS